MTVTPDTGTPQTRDDAVGRARALFPLLRDGARRADDERHLLPEMVDAVTGAGLVRVAYPAQGHDQVLAALAAEVSPRILNAPARLDAAAREIDEYFAGRRRVFDLPLDWRLARGFRRTVLGHLSDIAYGQTASYQAVAAAVNNPKAVRAVGTACATNPLPLVIPCHRVIRSDGLVGTYLGGAETKRQLLNLEAAA